MSDYQEEEYYEDDYENGELLEDELLEIQDEYRRRRLVESLIGPTVSTVFHVILIVIMAIFIIDKVQEPIADIEVTMEVLEDIEIEKLPEIDIPEPKELEPTVLTNEKLITVEVENPKAEDIALDDVSDDVTLMG